MYNKNEIIRMFVNNEIISSKRDLKGSNIICYYYENTNIRVLKNYSTIIAFVDCGENYNKVYLNKTKYSQTTTRNQNLIRYYASEIDELEYDDFIKLLRNKLFGKGC